MTTPEDRRVGPFAVKTAPSPEPKKPNYWPLRKIRWQARLGSPRLRREQREIARSAVEKGGGRPWYGEGLLVNHIAIGLFPRISLCWRPLRSTSSHMIPTPLGMVCRRCVRTWNAAAAEVRTDLVAQRRTRDAEDPTHPKIAGV